MRTSADLDEVDTTSMTTSFELAKTAVSQYAELVKASAEEKRKLAEKRTSQCMDNLIEISDEEEGEEDGDGEEDSESEATDTITVDKKRDSLVDIKVEESVAMDTMTKEELDEEADQLIADLQAGHNRNERPVSMISTGSADTGIVADISNGVHCSRRERPVSLISTSSVDTGEFLYYIY